MAQAITTNLFAFLKFFRLIAIAHIITDIAVNEHIGINAEYSCAINYKFIILYNAKIHIFFVLNNFS